VADEEALRRHRPVTFDTAQPYPEILALPLAEQMQKATPSGWCRPIPARPTPSSCG
jgi:hypothetical protein